jgi:hypothetical protein
MSAQDQSVAKATKRSAAQIPRNSSARKVRRDREVRAIN